MAELKTRPTAIDPDDFLAAVEHPGRRADAQRVAAIMREISGQPPMMWGTSIVGFGRYAYTYDSGHGGEWARIALSPRKAALSVYLMAGLAGHEALLARLGKHRIGKSCLIIGSLQQVDLGVLRELIGAGWREMAERYPG